MNNKKYFLVLFLILIFSVAGFLFFNQSDVEARTINCFDNPEHSDCTGGGYTGPSVGRDAVFKFRDPHGQSLTVQPGGEVEVFAEDDFRVAQDTSCPAVETSPTYNIGVTDSSGNSVFVSSLYSSANAQVGIGSLNGVCNTWCQLAKSSHSDGASHISYNWKIGTAINTSNGRNEGSTSWTFSAPTTPGTYTINLESGSQVVRTYENGCQSSWVISGGTGGYVEYLIDSHSSGSLTLTVEAAPAPVCADDSVADVVEGAGQQVHSVLTNDTGSPNAGDRWVQTHNADGTVLGCRNLTPSSAGSVTYLNAGASCGFTPATSVSADTSYTYQYTIGSPDGIGNVCTVSGVVKNKAIPTVTSPTSASVNTTSATLGANVTSLGIPASISARGICYRTTSNPSLTNGATCVSASGTTLGTYTSAITGLTHSTTYHYRGYATNSTGTAYTSDATFTTTTPAPTGTVRVVIVKPTNAPNVEYNLSGPSSWTTGNVTRAAGTYTYSSRATGDYSISVTDPGVAWSDTITPSSTQTLGNGETKTFTVTRNAVNDCSITLDSNRSWVANDTDTTVTVNPGASVPVDWSSSRVSGALDSSWGGTRPTTGNDNITAPSTPGTYVYTMTGTGTNGNSCTSNDFTIVVPTQTCDMVVTSNKATTFTINGISGTKSIAANTPTTYTISGHNTTTRGITPGSLFGYSGDAWLTSDGNPTPTCPKGGSIEMTINYSAQSPSCNFTGTTSSVQSGGLMTIQWDSSNISSALSASTNPSWSGWTGGKTTSGTASSVTAPTTDGDYTLSLSGTHPDGTTGSCSTTLTVTAIPPSTAVAEITSNLDSTSYVFEDSYGTEISSGTTGTAGDADTITFTVGDFEPNFLVVPASVTDYIVSVDPADQDIAVSATESFAITYSTILGTLNVSSNLANTGYSINYSNTIRDFDGTGTIVSANGTNSYVVVPGASGTTYTVTPDARTGYSVAVTAPTTISRGGTGAFTITYTELAASSASISVTTPISYNTSSEVTWSSANVSSCSVTKGGVAWSSNTSGNAVSSGDLTADTTFAITCVGIDGQNRTASATVTVNPQPTATVAVTSNLDTSYRINHDVTGDEPDTVSAGSTQTYSVILPSSEQRTYTITNIPDIAGYTKAVVSKIGTTELGTNSGTITASGQTLTFEITYTALAASSASISVNPTSVAYDGSSDVTWSSANVSSCSVTKDGVAWSTDTSGNAVSSGDLTADTVFEITCVGTDGANPTDSATVTVGAPSSNPTATLTAPSDGSVFQANDNISISADASDTDGTISSVSFYNGGTLLNTDTSSPYSYTWSNVPVGTYSITAVATDNESLTGTSAPASITVSSSNTATIEVTSNQDTSYRISRSVERDGSVSVGSTKTYSVTLPGSGRRSYRITRVPNIDGYSRNITAKIGGVEVGSTSGSTLWAEITAPGQTLTFEITYTSIATECSIDSFQMTNWDTGEEHSTNLTAAPGANIKWWWSDSGAWEDDNELEVVSRVISGGPSEPYGGTVPAVWPDNYDLQAPNDVGVYEVWLECQTQGTGEINESPHVTLTVPRQCGDGIDNDGDTLIDYGTGATNDPDCSSLNDNDESSPPPTFSLQAVGKLKQKSLSGRGTTTDAVIKVVPFNGFSEDVTLSYEGISPNLSDITIDLKKPVLTSGEYRSGSVFNIGLEGQPRQRNYTITVRGENPDGSQTRTATIILEIEAISSIFFEEF